MRWVRGLVLWLFSSLTILAAILLFVASSVIATLIYVDQMRELPKVRMLEKLTVDGGALLAGTGPARVVVGQVLLGQNAARESAEERHIAIDYDPDTGFSLGNIATNRRLGLSYVEGFVTDIDYVLQEGDVFTLGGRAFKVSRPDSSTLVLRDNSTDQVLLRLPRAYYATDGGDPKWYDWMSYSATFGGRIAHDPAAWGDRFSARDLAEVLLERDAAPAIVVPLRDLPANAVSIRHVDGRYLLSLRAARTVAVCPSGGTCFELGRQAWPVSHPDLGKLNTIIAGRTRYDVTVLDKQLSFSPTDRIHWLTRQESDAIGAMLPSGVDAFLTNQNNLAVYISRAVPDPTSGAEATGLLHQVTAAMSSFFEATSRFQKWTPFAAAFIMAVLYVVFLDEDWTTRLFLRLPGLVLLSLILAPGLRTLPVIPALAPVEIFSILMAAGVLTTRLLRLMFDLRRITPRGFLRAPIAFLNQRRKAELRLGFEMGLVLLAALTLYISGPVALTTLPGYDTGAAVVSVFALYALAGIALVHRYRSPLLIAFWVALFVVIASGMIALGKLTFGQDMARYVSLYHRHVAVIGLIAAGAVWFSSIEPKAVIEATRKILFLVSRDMKLSVFQVVFGLIPLGICGLLLVPEFLSSTPPIIGYFGQVDVPVAWLHGIVMAVVAAVAITAAFLLWYGKRASEAQAGASTRRRIHAPISWLSLYFLAPSLVLALIVFITPETGIAGLQPSEFTKTWLAFLFALLLARWVQAKAWRMPFEQGRSRIGLLLTCLILAAFFALGSYINFDLSPAAIVLMMALGMGVMLFVEWVRAKLTPSVTLGLIACLGLGLWGYDGSFGPSDAFIMLAFALLVWPVLIDPSARRRVHISPWLLRNPMARMRKRSWTQRWAARLRKNQSGVALSVIGMFIALGIAIAAYTDFKRLSDIETYRDYDVSFLGLSLPSTPLERVMSFLDARLPFPGTETAGAAQAIIVDYPDLSLQVRESREIVAASGCGLSVQLRQHSEALDDARAEDGATLFDRLQRRLASLVNGLHDRIRTFCDDASLPFPKAGLLDSAILDLPAVQDDFAPALLVSVLGIDGARLLLAAQIVIVAALVSLCLSVSQQVRRLSSFRGVGLLGAIFLGNLSFVFVAQMTLSWSNMLGLLPVVGQPMTFISLGASHHLFFALPLVFSALLCAALSHGLDEAGQPRKSLMTGAQLKRHIYEDKRR